MLHYPGYVSGLTVGPGGGFGYGAAGALGGARVAGASPLAPGHAALNRLGTPNLGQAFSGNGSTGNPFSTLGRHVNKIMSSRGVVSWGNPTTRL